ncbi:hypothetical protein ACWGJ2_39860 [Streptomyces sp. NPDC054796]
MAVLVGLLVRRSGLKGSHAVVCVLFGFYLADSSLAPVIDRLVEAVVDALGRVRL